MIERINAPADLKKLNTRELIQLAAEIRELIIATVSRTGGHLASSLGAVELCLSLQCCLDTPQGAFDATLTFVGSACREPLCGGTMR